ncbi:uncharacterized protein LOC107766756 [Nicotiana tabacum]|uniref:uncharacterized protein LOC107766756 n=1 Tax=Nicotiana tabacum TaxID=4097 RepID=UPI0008786A61
MGAVLIPIPLEQLQGKSQIPFSNTLFSFSPFSSSASGFFLVRYYILNNCIICDGDDSRWLLKKEKNTVMYKPDIGSRQVYGAFLLGSGRFYVESRCHSSFSSQILM